MGELRINLTNFLTVTIMAFLGLTLIKKVTGMATKSTGA
jgi:hypothetical protein